MAVRKRRSSRSKRKGKFEYKHRSKEQFNRSASESSGNYDTYIEDGIQTYKPHDGSNQIRILPPTFEEAEDFALTLPVHFGMGADSQSYVCRKFLGDDETCPFCEESKRLNKEGESEDASLFKAKKRKLFYLIDRKGDTNDPMVWAAPFNTWKDIILQCKDEDGEVVEVDNPDEGCDVLFNKEGTGQRTKYVGVKLGKSKPMLRDEGEQDETLDMIMEKPLTEIVKVYDEEYLEGVLEGTVTSKGDDDDDEEEDDERSSRSRKRRSSKKTSSKRRRSRRDEEEDDDDDGDEDEDEDEDLDEDEDEEDDDVDDYEEEEDDEEDEDEDEEDEDEDEDDDEEEEEKPRSRRSRSSKGSSRASSAKSKLRSASKRSAKKTTRRRR